MFNVCMWEGGKKRVGVEIYGYTDLVMLWTLNSQTCPRFFPSMSPIFVILYDP